MTSKKCQLKLGQKNTYPNHNGHVQDDLFKMTSPKWLGGFFYTYPKWGFFTKLSSKKKRNSSSECPFKHVFKNNFTCGHHAPSKINS